MQDSRYTRQKLKFAALQRDELLCSQFVSDVSIYEKDMLVLSMSLVWITQYPKEVWLFTEADIYLTLPSLSHACAQREGSGNQARSR